MATTLPRKPKTPKPPKPVKEKTPRAAKEKPVRAPRTPRPVKEPRAAKTKQPREAKAAKPRTVKETGWESPVRPSLVLLPQKIRGARAKRRAVTRAIFLSLALLGATFLAYLPVAGSTAMAHSDLDKEQQITTKQNAYLTKNAGVQTFFDGFIARKDAASQALEQDVDYSRVLQAVNAANTVGAHFTGINKAADNKGCASQDPFTPSQAIGCLSLTGDAPSVTAVGQLVGSMSAAGGILTDPFASETLSTDKGASFKLTVGYTSKAFSFKGQAFKPTDDELKSLDTPLPAQAGTGKSGTTPAPAATQGATK